MFRLFAGFVVLVLAAAAFGSGGGSLAGSHDAGTEGGPLWTQALSSNAPCTGDEGLTTHEWNGQDDWDRRNEQARSTCHAS